MFYSHERLREKSKLKLIVKILKLYFKMKKIKNFISNLTTKQKTI